MNRKNVLIIGFGKMGLAYFSSFLSFPGPIQVLIFDVDVQSGKKRLGEKHIPANVVVTWLDNLQDLARSDIYIDFCVNSASLQARWIYQDTLESIKIGRMFYEKPLLSRNYKTEIKQIAAIKVSDARVNFSRRMARGFVELKEKYRSQIKALTVVGTNLNMGSNWSHFVDLFCWLTETQIDSLDFDISWVSTERAGYHVVEGQFQAMVGGEVGIRFVSNHEEGAKKNYSSSIHLNNGDNISYREVFGTQAFGSVGAFDVIIPLTSDADFSPMISGMDNSIDSNITLPQIFEVLDWVVLGTESFYAALDSAGYYQVEVT